MVLDPVMEGYIVWIKGKSHWKVLGQGAENS